LQAKIVLWKLAIAIWTIVANELIRVKQKRSLLVLEADDVYPFTYLNMLQYQHRH
jgi:hypothetical protein